MYSNGLAWAQAPFGLSLGLLMSGLFFARKMREQGFVTMLDPFTRKYGDVMGGLLFLPALAGDLLWAAGTLFSIGATLKVIIDIETYIAIIVSAAITVIYTLLGGLISVAYTDVVQLFFMFVGLWLSVPFAMMHPAVTPLAETKVEWLGTIKEPDIGVWLDYAVLLTLGGIPWQVYFQRVLSAKSTEKVRLLSITAGFGCLLMAVPAAFIGAIAVSTDWNQTGYGLIGNLTESGRVRMKDHSLMLPLVLNYLTPQWVSIVGLGAVSAAVMSSIDSIVLSVSSLFANNVYKAIFRKKASQNEILWVFRVTVVVTGAASAAIGIMAQSVYALVALCVDFVYVILFPQLLLVLYMKQSNTYGSLAGFIVGLVLRLGGGEPLLSMPGFIPYPSQTPFRTVAMLSSLVTIVVVSLLMHWLFHSRTLSPKKDVFKAVIVPATDEDGNTIEMTVKREEKDVTKSQ